MPHGRGSLIRKVNVCPPPRVSTAVASQVRYPTEALPALGWLARPTGLRQGLGVLPSVLPCSEFRVEHKR